MINTAKPLPIDRNNVPMYNSPPPYPAIATTARDNATASSVMTFNANTTTLEVTAVTTGAAIKWATNQATSVITAAGTANFDNFIPANTTRIFAIPRQTAGVPSIVGLNAQNGLYSIVATKTVGVGSVLVAEY